MADHLHQSIELLFPPGTVKPAVRFFDQDLKELECVPLIHTLAGEQKQFNQVKSIIQQFTNDPNVINYRLDIIEDLMKYPDLMHGMENSMMIIDQMQFATSKKYANENEMLQTVSRLRELTLYVDFITQMMKAFSGREELQSVGLRRLRDRIIEIAKRADFKNLSEQLPKLQKGLDSISSVTIGINLDAQMNPVQATLLSINDERFSGASLFGKLFTGGNEYQGISELYKDPDYIENENAFHSPDKMSASISAEEEASLRRILFRDLKKLLKNVLKPVHPIIEKYVHVRCQWILALESEIAFYIGAVKFINKIRTLGMPMCRPVILPMEHKECRLEDNYNIALALRMSYKYTNSSLKEHIVPNNVAFNEEGRIFILTGPNSGGKTTYAQAIGLTQLLMQSGLYVPCSQAAMSPVDTLHVYFNVEENASMETGRLGVESKRISEIFQAATPSSMILLNESFSSTSPGESYYLMKDIVSALRLLGVRAVVATHLHDLAESIDQINAEIDGKSKLISMVAGIKENTGYDRTVSNRSYKVLPGRPQGKSFAMDIAKQYGISFDQLAETIGDRR